MSSAGKAYRLLWILPFILLGFGVYSNAIQVPFYFDDMQNIVENPAIRLTDFSFANLIKAGADSPIKNRPVAYISFALNYLIHQYDVGGYHVVNIVIHILTSVLLFFFFRVTLTATTINKNIKYPEWAAFFAALLWLVHPIQTQSVTYVVQRMNCLAAMFFVLSLLLYIHGRLTKKIIFSIISFTGCFVSWLLAITSKEIAATLPFFVLLYEWYFFQDMSLAWLKKQRMYLAGLFFLLLLLVYVFIGPDPINSVLGGYRYEDFNLTQRVLTQFRVIFIYLGLFMVPIPSRLSLEHDLVISQSLFVPPTTIVAILAVTGLFIAAMLVAKKHRLFSFAVLWFLGNLLIESSIIALELIFEHRMYLPSMFLCLLLSILCFRYLGKWLAVGVLVFIVLWCSVWAFERNATWKEPITFYKNIVENAPGNWRANYNYGVYLYKASRYEESIPHLQKTIELEPRHLVAYQELGLAYTMNGEYEAALQQFNIVRQVTPFSSELYKNIGFLYLKKGDKEKALVHYMKAVSLAPENIDAQLRTGYLYANLGNYRAAIEHLKKVLSMSAEHRFEMLNNIGIFYAETGDYESAIRYFEEALQLNPDHERLKFNLELARQKQSQ